MGKIKNIYESFDEVFFQKEIREESQGKTVVSQRCFSQSSSGPSYSSKSKASCLGVQLEVRSIDKRTS